MHHPYKEGFCGITEPVLVCVVGILTVAMEMKMGLTFMLMNMKVPSLSEQGPSQREAKTNQQKSHTNFEGLG